MEMDAIRIVLISMGILLTPMTPMMTTIGSRFGTMAMMASGPSLCNVIEVKRCVADVTIESSQEALRAVASCYQTTCPLALE